MDSLIDERDYALLKQDPYTFGVLRRIIGGECELLLTDHQRIILCYTTAPFPVWIWTPDDLTEKEAEQVYQLIAENGFLSSGHQMNIKYSLADFLIRRAEQDGKTLRITMNMFAYDCPAAIPPAIPADGKVHRCTPEDTDTLTDFIGRFHEETGVDIRTREAYHADAEAFIQSGDVYFWLDADGTPAASCKLTPEGEYSTVNLVYTRPECRRKHYAAHLVYDVTKRALDAGSMPMLYTNADYIASNACYEKIGYILRGKLCTVTVQ